MVSSSVLLRVMPLVAAAANESRCPKPHSGGKLADGDCGQVVVYNFPCPGTECD